MTVAPTGTTLAPSFAIPLVLTLAGAGLCFLSPWVGVPVALFALFLLVQTASLRLQFTERALEVSRNGTVFRSFPYDEWIHWELWWDRFPVLFYFREVKSIHFLPILFDAVELRRCLELHCSRRS
jgi:hypothetical protein